LPITFERLQQVVPLPSTLFVGQYRSFDRSRLNHAKDLSADCFIHGDAAEGDAARFAVIKKSTYTGIPQNIVPVAGISYGQLTSTTSAPQEPSQQGLTITRGAGLGFSVVVLLDRMPDALEFFPWDVTLVSARISASHCSLGFRMQIWRAWDPS
jgi:hypothetical protein